MALKVVNYSHTESDLFNKNFDFFLFFYISGISQ